MSLFRRETAPPALTASAGARGGRLRAVTSSVMPLNDVDKSEVDRLAKRRGKTWQTEAWEYYDSIGEIKYAFNLVAFAVSRIRLFPAVELVKGQEPVYVKDVEDLTPGLAEVADRALNRLDNGIGMAEILRRMALNFQVAAECYLVQKPRLLGTGASEHWSVRSVDELEFRDDPNPTQSLDGKKRTQYGVRRGPGSGSQDVDWLPVGTFVSRMWRSHPRYEYEPDSSMLSILELCDELLLLNRMIRNVARSRLNAGILYVPDEISLSRDAFEDDDDELSAQEFESELMVALSQPVTDEAAASAIVPLLVRGPKDLKDAIKHITMERGLSPDLVARADRVLDRIMQGIDLPKDVVTGLANVKYSNALQIDNSLYQAHIEPLVQLIVQQLTEAYLRPALPSYGFTPEQAKRVVIWYDASEILTDNQRAQASNDGVANFAISLAAWRRENGFGDKDAPDANEMILRLLLARGEMSDPLTQAMFKVIAPRLMDATRSADQDSSVAPLPEDVMNMLGGDVPAPEEGVGQPTDAAPAAPTPAAPALETAGASGGSAPDVL